MIIGHKKTDNICEEKVLESFSPFSSPSILARPETTDFGLNRGKVASV